MSISRNGSRPPAKGGHADDVDDSHRDFGGARRQAIRRRDEIDILPSQSRFPILATRATHQPPARRMAPADTVCFQMAPTRRFTWLILAVAFLSTCAAAAPFVLTGGPGPQRHTSIRGVEIVTHGVGPYRHMPADVAVQGLAQDVVTLAVGVPFLLLALVWARKGTRAGHLTLSGAVAYLFVQYFMYLGMGTYNEFFLLWVAIVLLSSQALFRLLLAVPTAAFEMKSTSVRRRRYVGGFLLLNGALIALLWLQVIVPPLLNGTLYPAGLAHSTTMFVQGFDLALFLPLSLIAGVDYLKRRAAGALLAPVYTVFVSLQMLALLAKIVWMSAIGVNAGPALVVIPLLLGGAVAAAVLSLLPHRRALVT